ncbi:MAG TPA: DUF3047 domain-containing protein [Methylomirabilota bacterium]|nr:DUF3047 domain-containing protein [Methylomirabilota bacterium]
MALIALLLLGAGALVILSNPRHRAFHLGLMGATRGASGLTTAAALSLAGSPLLEAGRGTAVAEARNPTPDAEGRVRVPVADWLPARLPSSGAPAGWRIAAFTGDASVELVRNEGRVAMRLRSERTSFAMHRDVVVDLQRHPILTWSWKVNRLPAGGDVRDSRRDDQAAQVYVVFPRWPSPRTSSDVLGYVWDARAPAGTRLTHPKAPNVRIVVLQSGGARLDTWVREQRNVAEDYRALFGRQPLRVGKVALMIDSNDTRSAAEALFGDLTFARPGSPQHTEIPMAVLR